MNRPVVIAGFMGAGKTTVARAVAELLRCTATDLDAAIEQQEQRSPKEIINRDGEAAFRDIETRNLERVLAIETQQVIALGGGAWTLKRNRDLVAEHGGLTVWLDTPFETCWRRIAISGSERPLAPTKEQAKALYEQRREYYELASLHIIADGENDVAGLASTIVKALN